MLWFRVMLRKALYAVPLLGGPWLLSNGVLLIWQGIINIDPPADLPTRIIAFACGVISIMWAIHGLMAGPNYIRDWWLMTCSLMNILFAVGAYHHEYHPEYLRPISVVLYATWSLYLIILFSKRQQEARE